MEKNRMTSKDQKAIKKEKRVVHWTPPSLDAIKINFDGSVRGNGQATVGCVFRNHKGEVIHTAAHKDTSTSPLLTEARALRLACAEAVRLKFNNVIFEGDCLTVIKAVL